MQIVFSPLSGLLLARRLAVKHYFHHEAEFCGLFDAVFPLSFGGVSLNVSSMKVLLVFPKTPRSSYAADIFYPVPSIPQATLSAIENDRAELGVERAKVLARVLKCRPAVLVFPGWDIAHESAAR